MTTAVDPTNTTATADSATRALAGRETLRLCTAGSVDDGKSTFVGRLLHDTKSVLADTLEQVTRTSAQRGFQGLDLSLLVDGLRAEREQGITIDVAYRYFSTPVRSFILADTPGHVQYTRNTVTGISTSQVVVLLVDARHGVVEQTRRHLRVAGLLGVKTIVLAVNKIDLVDYSQEVFTQIESEFTQAAHDAGIADPHAVPISALLGDNVAQRSMNTQWYTGPTVLELLETIEVSHGRADDLNFRFPIQYVIREHAADYRGYAGRVKAGSIAVGGVVETPHGATTVTAIDGTDGPQQEARTGDSVVLRLADEFDLTRGDLLAVAPPLPTRRFSAHFVGLTEQALAPQSIVKVRYGTALVKGRIQAAQPIALNDIVEATVELAQPLPVEKYQARGAVGALLLICPSSGNTLAAGLVQEPEAQK